MSLIPSPEPEDSKALAEFAKAVVTALLTGGGALFGGPGGAAAGAFASQGALSVIDGLSEHWQQNQRRQGAQAIDIAVHWTGMDHETLARSLVRNPAAMQVAVAAIQIASETTLLRKVELMGRVVGNAATDDARLDESLLITRAVRYLEAPHFRALALLKKPVPVDADSAGYWTPARLVQRTGWQAASVSSVVLTLQSVGAVLLKARILDGGDAGDGTFTLNDEVDLSDMACEITDFGSLLLDSLPRALET